MRPEGHQTSRDPLEVAERRFARWRADGSPGRSIPEDLWQAAVEAARVHGVNRTSLALHLNHTKLQARAASAPERPAPRSDRVEFLQVPPVALSAGPECVVEVEDARGARLKVELAGRATAGLDGVLRAVWGAR